MSSKLFTAALGAAVVLAAMAGTAHATVIGLNFNDTPTGANAANSNLLTSDVTGAPGGASAGWQNSVELSSFSAPDGGYIKSDFATVDLLDSNGASTTATLNINPNGNGLNGIQILSGPGNWNSDSTDDGFTGEQKLYNGFLTSGGGRTTELALSAIPYASYNLYIYLSYSTYQNGSLQLFKNSDATQGTAPVYFASGLAWQPGSFLPTTYTQITSTDSANPTATGSAGGYVEYTGLTDADESIDFIGNGGIAGIEIVPNAVPEPASLGALAIGGLGLLLRRRRRA